MSPATNWQQGQQTAMSIEYSPHKNPKAISLIEQPDGNWIGEMFKFGKIITARDIGPTDVLVRLIVSNGIE